MIKKLLVAIMIALPTLGFAQGKFGIVNTQSIIQDLPDTKAAQEQLQAANQKLQEEFKALETEYNKKFEAIQGLAEDTPAVIRDRHVKDIQNMEQNIRQFQMQAEQDMNRQQEQLFAPITQKIQDAIQAVGKEGGYTFVFEQGVPLYVGTDVTDCTPAVRAKLGLK